MTRPSVSLFVARSLTIRLVFVLFKADGRLTFLDKLPLRVTLDDRWVIFLSRQDVDVFVSLAGRGLTGLSARMRNNIDGDVVLCYSLGRLLSELGRTALIVRPD